MGRTAVQVLARGVAAFVGAFSLGNAVGELAFSGFDATLLWVDLRGLSRPVTVVGLMLTGVFFLAFAVAPRAPRWRRSACAALAALLCTLSLRDAWRYLALRSSGELFDGPLLPFSLLPATGMALVAAASAFPVRARSPRRDAVLAAAAACAVAIAFPVGLMATIGNTDYRRPADLVVVMGARAYADGTPSLSLLDRTRTGSELVLQGYADAILFSGGPGDGAFHETEVMRGIALDLGVPAEAIAVDEGGWSTADTARHTAALARERGLHRVLAVSHGYHLARVKLALEREGLLAYTVPARETRPLRKAAYFAAREVAALAVYWIRF